MGKNYQKIHKEEINEGLRYWFGQNCYICRSLPIHNYQNGRMMVNYRSYDILVVEQKYVDYIIDKDKTFIYDGPFHTIEIKCTEDLSEKGGFNDFSGFEVAVTELALHPDIMFTHHVVFIDIVNGLVSYMEITQFDKEQVQKLRNRNPNATPSYKFKNKDLRKWGVRKKLH